MSGSGEEAAPVNLRDDLSMSFSSEDEAADAGRPDEAAMDDDKAPPAVPEAGTSAATSAGRAPEDRQPAEVARTEPTHAYACPKCTYTSASKGNLATHVRSTRRYKGRSGVHTSGISNHERKRGRGNIS